MIDKYDRQRETALRDLLANMEVYVLRRNDALVEYESSAEATKTVYRDVLAAINEQEVADAFQNAPVIEFDVRGVEVEHDQALERDSWDRADRAVELANNDAITAMKYVSTATMASATMTNKGEQQ